jgi:uncharacterized protein YbjT (DUF2867 family)
MRVLVTGGYGLIGSACLARLHREGHELTACGRSIAEARRRFAYARWLEADFHKLTRPEDWAPLVVGIDAVVNCVGALQDSARDDLRTVQVTATAALFAACERAGVRRVVHLSAIGAEHSGPTEFSRSKADAEDDLAARNLDWVILRPGLVLGPAAFGGTALRRGLAAVPLMTPLVAPEARMQVIGLDDLADAVARCVSPDAPAKVKWDVAHPEVHTVADIVQALRTWLGFPPRAVVPMPSVVGRVAAAAADALGWLGWRTPMRSTAIAQLVAGVVGDPAPWLKQTGAEPKNLADLLAQIPASVQERWFARLYLLKPVLFAALAFFWVFTGAIALGPGRAAANAQLAATGFPPAAVEMTVFWGAVFDVAMGFALLVRRLARPVLIVMLIATPLYLLAGTYLAPQLWIDPLGPLAKIIPMLAATAFALAILDER